MRPMDNPPLPYNQIVDRVGVPVVAVVTGVGVYQGLAVMRGLGRMGIPVCALGKAGSVGFHSRYASESWVTPDTHTHADELLKVMLSAGKKLKAEGRKGVLIPTQDSMVEFCSRNRDVLGEFFICHLPPHEVIASCSDKKCQYSVAEQQGVPYPTTYFDSDIERLLEDLERGRMTFPVLFKARKELPLEIRKRFRLVILNNQTEVKELLEAVSPYKIPFVIQEIIPGEDDSLYTLGSTMTKDGNFSAVFTGRKLRQRPPKFGECRVGESKPVPQLVEYGEKLLRGLGYYGISQVEFKYDHRDGRYKLMEVNPRSWSWVGLPIGMGVNLPYAYFCDALGISISRQEMPEKRALYISLFDDLYWSLKARDGKPWAHLFKGYDIVVEPYYCKDDRKPGLIHFGRYGKEFAGMAVNKILKTAGIKRNQ